MGHCKIQIEYDDRNRTHRGETSFMVPDKATPEEIQELANTFVGELLEDFKAIVRRRQLMDAPEPEPVAEEPADEPDEDTEGQESVGETDAAEVPPPAEG